MRKPQLPSMCTTEVYSNQADKTTILMPIILSKALRGLHKVKA